jgi:C4-dicarboxylate-specific signal transduction histidine kinase
MQEPLFKKAEPTKEALDLNEAIREILLLARSEMNKRQVALRLELADDLPPALGDKVQLQQVILNGIDAMNTVEDRSRDLIVRTQCSEETSTVTT